MGLLITLVLGGFVLLGAVVAYFARGSHMVEQLSVAIALGTLSMLAILDLLPETLEHLDTHYLTIVIGVAAGAAVLKVLDLFIPDHDAHHSHHGQPHEYTEKNVTHVGIIAAVAVTLHNIIEGMAVYSLSEQSAVTGAMVALGVGLHNIPMGMIICSTLHRKRERRIMLSLAALSTFAGGVLMRLLWSAINDTVVGVLIAVTLGMILYIVVFELIPAVLHIRNKRISGSGILIGMALILASACLGG